MMYNEDEITKVQHAEEEKSLNLIKRLLQKAFCHLADEIMEFPELAWFANNYLLHDDYQEGALIYAILAILTPLGTYHSLIFGRKGIRYVNQAPSEVIDELCRQVNRISNYKDLSTILKKKLGATKARYIPYLCPDFALMPLVYPGAKEMAWINPNFIDDILIIDEPTNQVGVTLSFGLTIPLPFKKTSDLKNHMTESFYLHALIRREHQHPEPRNEESLSHFLKLRKSPLIRAASYRCYTRDLFGKKGQLTMAAREYMAEELIKQDLLAEDVAQIIKAPLPN